jgi:hypothetical protein
LELWELIARESIRDLVARYNANGDTGRFAQLLELFADDAVMEVGDGRYQGHDEIRMLFMGTQDTFKGASSAGGPPPYVRHFTATLQIDLIDGSHATGRCYFQVLMSHGLDHWGRYLDEYEERDGKWLFTRRRATQDGSTPATR